MFRIRWQCLLLTTAWIVGMIMHMSAFAVNLVIATVDNGHMLTMQKLSYIFEKHHPDIKVRWVTLKENELRQLVRANITTRSGQIDIMTLGMYEVPIWAKRGWLKPIQTDDGYNTSDLLVNIREGLSYKNHIYALPIYGESSFVMYRKDLMRKAGLTMPDNPTWTQIAAFAEKLNNPSHDVHGICLRSNPGWGENMTLVTTMVNAHGGQWFDMQWHPQLLSQPWKDAVSLYVGLLRKYGPQDGIPRGYNGNLALFQSGKCAIWVDATVAAGFITNPKLNPWANHVGFAQAPSGVTSKGSHWLWAWALAIPAYIDSNREQAAQKFINWATSRGYLNLVASRDGWGKAPSGTRKSTYNDKRFLRDAPWAKVELKAIQSANPNDATLPKSPYSGVQFAVIPEFAFIGDKVGKFIAEAVAGRLSVEDALAQSQYAAKRQMIISGYPEAGDCMRSNAPAQCP